MENVRIDKGVKRGPRNKHIVKARKPDGQSPTVPADLNPDHVLHRYLAEQSTSQIAVDLGIKRRALTRWLRQTRPEQWKEVQVIRALCMKEDGEEGLYDAATALDLARARELVRVGQWELERLDSNNYGQKQEVTHNLPNGPLINISLSPGQVIHNAAPQLPQSSVEITGNGQQQIEDVTPIDSGS